MQCSRVNSRGRSRGVQQGAVHQGAIVTILNQIVSFAGRAAFLRLVGNFNLDLVFGVVEINDVNVKDEHSRARNEVACSRRANKNKAVSHTHKQELVVGWSVPSVC